MLRFWSSFVVALVVTAFAHAQTNCPMEAARRIDMSVVQGQSQNCGGLNWSVGNVQVSTTRDNCPLFVIVTPAHDVAATSRNFTQVVPTASMPVTKVTFVCRPDYFLIFHIGSACVYGNQLNLGVVQLLNTQACEFAEAT
jgi:hypothetical protein